jgi:chemosensory pili system protein ChpA (sensor histidine kinase/response regulator)
MAPRAGFDVGPLSWVKNEIDSALQRGVEALSSCAASPSGGDDLPMQLKLAQAHLHQACGALQIVALDGVTRVAQELEGLLADLDRDPGRRSGESLAVAERAFHDVRTYLDELLAGKPHQPLRLLPVYSALLGARGAGPADPTDLYFPDLSRRPPRTRRAAPSLHPDESKLYLREQRARYQRGLLAFLRDERSGVQEMRAAVEAIELLQSVAAQRPFWWVALGFFDALVHEALLPEEEQTRRAAKRLCNRIEQQIRLLAEGTQNVAERLMREALYFVARATPASEHLREVQQTYQLAGTLPAEPAQDGASAALEHALDTARELHAKAKDAWDRFATGQATSLATFCKASSALSALAGGLGNPALGALLERIAAAGDWLAGDPARMSEALALEQATALLFAGSALEGFGALSDEFEQQARLVCARLTDCIEGRLLRKALDIPLLDDMSRRAQEALIAQQTLAELQARLRSVEQLLDRFFRDPSRRSELSGIGEPLEQLDRAFELLGEARAREALAGCVEQIRQFSASDFVPRQPEFAQACEQLAQTLSGLGFYVDALSRGSADFDQAMRPVSMPSEQAEQALELQPTVEEQLVEKRGQVRKLAEAWSSSPGEVSLKQELRNTLAAIQHDAGLIADARLEAAAAQALRALENAPTPAEPQLARSLEQIAPEAAPPAPSPAAERVAESSAQLMDVAIDAELLAVYLEEAGEVVANVRTGLQALRANAADHEVLAGIRRGFHTLKGSGRMVGLARLGEAAWAVERALNLWLQQGKPADRSLLDFVMAAAAYFADSVASMSSGGSAPDEAPLLDLSEALHRGEQLRLPADSAVMAEHIPAPAPVHTAEASAARRVPEDLLPADSNEEQAFVEVGTQRISATLFTLFSGEARMRLAALKEEHETLKAHGVITDEMMRAVHTLAGIAGTVQLDALRALAYAFEQALSSLALGPLSPEEEALIEQATDAVEHRVMQALDLVEPAPAPELVVRLEQLALAAAPAAFPGQHGGPAETMGPEEESPSAPMLPPGLGAAAAEGPPEPGPPPIAVELDWQLLPLFLEEAGELVPSIAALLREWRAEPGDTQKAQALKRALHTLKGSARMAGAVALGALTHDMETCIERSLAPGVPSPLSFEELEGSMDRMGLLLAQLQQAAREPAADGAGGGAETSAPAPEPAAMLRVRAELIDQLVNEAGEVSIARSRIEGEIGSLRATVLELTDNVARLRSQLREMEIHAESQMQSSLDQAQASHRDFDPLELDRFTRFQELARLMAESVNDVQTVHQNLVYAMDATDSALASQAQLNRDLQQDLMRVRMLPFASLADRLHGSVRQAARDLGKRVRLDIRGAQVVLDRSVLERMTAPLEHLLRNAVTHGIESPQARADAGKPAMGEIRLEVSQEGNEVVMVLADDGAGLDIERLGARARELGVPGAESKSVAEIAELIFVPGLSTASEVSESAGRGVGMDVVKNGIASLGGRIDVSFERGRGTRFAIYLPLTVAVTQAVIVKAAERIYALPTVMVEHVMQLRASELQALREQARAEDAQPQLEWQARRYPFHELPVLLGLAQPAARRASPVLFVRSGVNAVALQADEILSSSQEIVVKAIGPQIARLTGVTGATVLGSGGIVLILNPVELALRSSRAGGTSAASTPAPAGEQQPTQIAVMVVDDSLTVRKFTGRLLERQGYRVLTARDGVEAMEQLQTETPAVMLVDIEMPRMDGFDLTRKIRAEARFAGIPIIMITSRAAEKHEQYAREIGVDHYLGKPFQEDELLGRIARFAAAGRAPGVACG